MEQNRGLVIKFDTDEKSATLIKCCQSPALVWHCEIKLLQLNSPIETSEGWLNSSASVSESLPSCSRRIKDKEKEKYSFLQLTEP